MFHPSPAYTIRYQNVLCSQMFVSQFWKIWCPASKYFGFSSKHTELKHVDRNIKRFRFAEEKRNALAIPCYFERRSMIKILVAWFSDEAWDELAFRSIDDRTNLSMKQTAAQCKNWTVYFLRVRTSGRGRENLVRSLQLNYCLQTKQSAFLSRCVVRRNLF